MNARTRRKIEMGKRALEFSRAHPDPSAGYTAAVTRLADAIGSAEQVAAQQRDGLLQVRAATSLKESLRRTMKQGHLMHVAQAARLAGREVPALSAKFLVVPETTPYLPFRTAAGAVADEAEANKDLLIRFGLHEPVLESLKASLAQFDAALERGTQGRRYHVGASADLEALATDVVQLVRLMDGMNRLRFADDAHALAEWHSASSVAATPRGVTEPPAGPGEPPVTGGEVKPAA